MMPFPTAELFNATRRAMMVAGSVRAGFALFAEGVAP
jgi:hypothetical protein